MSATPGTPTCTTFKIYLPRTGESSHPLPARVTAKPASAGAERILLVEDDAMVRQVTRRSLQHLGYDVVEASNGVEALKLWARNGQRIGLVLSDMSMPQMTGLELASALRTRDPHVAIVIMSGYTEYTFGRGARLDPGISFIEKPFTPEQLGERVRRVLDGERDS